MRLFDRLAMTLEGVKMALESLKANKVRAALTISGVAVGVFVVVAMGATVHGIKQSFQSDMDEFGTSTFQVRRRNPGFNNCNPTVDCPDRRNPGVSLAEWLAIQQLPEVESAMAWLFGQGTASYRDRIVKNVGYDAQSTEWIRTDQADIFPGRTFTQAEHDAAALVTLVNAKLATELFGDSDPIGKEIELDGTRFQVIGVYHTKAGFLKSLDGRGPDTPRMVLPMMTAWRRLDVWRRSMMLMVKPAATSNRDDAMDAVTATLRGMRGLRPSEVNTFYLVGQDKMMETFNQLFGAIFMVGIGLSAVGLLVGGVGVVAIMMISVTERTREIGVRKALGATRGIILWQFLVEAATLTTLGALIGLVLGGLLAWVIRANSTIPASIPLGAIIASLAGAALTGVAFGMLPATRASKLDPVEALRHERFLPPPPHARRFIDALLKGMRTPRALVALSLVALACRPAPEAPAIGFTYNWGDGVLEGFVQAQVNADSTQPPLRLLASRDGGWQAFGSSPMAAEVRRAQLLSENPDVIVVVGPGGSREALQVAPVYGEAGMPVLIPTATSRLLDAAGAHLFRMAANDSVQGEFIAQFADSALQAKSLAVYHVPDEYGIGLAAGTVATLRQRGIDLRERTPVRLLQPCSDDDGRAYYQDLTRELEQRGRPDAVVLAMRTVEVACFVRALRARWPDLPVIAGDGAYLDQTLLGIAGDAAAGAYFVTFWHPALPHEASQRFVTAYRAAVGRMPRHGDAVFVDAAMLAASAIRSGARTREDVTAYLQSLGRDRPAFDGIIGPVSFAPNAPHALYMTRVERDGSSTLVAK